MDTTRSFIFIGIQDELALLINEKANLLYHQLTSLDIDALEFDEFGKYYFSNHHGGRRLFFSMQSSADIIYRSIKKNGRAVDETSFLDYGAGLGTLFLLASQVGFKQVYYNDYFENWTTNANKLCHKLNITISGFITGDIDAVIDYGKLNNTRFDIIASRNVAEHIYSLRDFYSKIYQSGLTTVCYASTTANYHNIAMRLKHYWYHRKIENRQFKPERKAFIRKLKPGIKESDLALLADITRGRAFTDLTHAIELYLDKKPVPPVEFLGTNTCYHETGVWAENLLTRKQYETIIQDAGFTADYTPGFWDTHYKYAALNFLTGIFNRIIKRAGKKGYWLSPFVNVVASKTK